MIAHLHKSPISSYAAPAVCLKSEISTDAPGYNPPVNANSPSCSLFFFKGEEKERKKGKERANVHVRDVKERSMKKKTHT